MPGRALPVQKTLYGTLYTLHSKLFIFGFLALSKPKPPNHGWEPATCSVACKQTHLLAQRGHLLVCRRRTTSAPKADFSKAWRAATGGQAAEVRSAQLGQQALQLPDAHARHRQPVAQRLRVQGRGMFLSPHCCCNASTCKVSCHSVLLPKTLARHVWEVLAQGLRARPHENSGSACLLF